METIIMHPDELNAILGQRSRPGADAYSIKPTKSFVPTPCRQSELELIFQVRRIASFMLPLSLALCLLVRVPLQKRAQRNEQNLT